ncbi:DUF3325 domain-containing protein [Roseateles sp.]|uniref:DUF3325 domain-containing protein n=1 Tax=Roseateles sp. TaxID=1971397 RepID=UPI0039EBB27C
MADAIWLAGALLLAVLGMACLALSLEAHWAQVRGRGDPPRRVLRVLGWAGLAASLAACLVADHGTMAALVWPMTLAAAAVMVAFTFSWLAER